MGGKGGVREGPSGSGGRGEAPLRRVLLSAELSMAGVAARARPEGGAVAATLCVAAREEPSSRGPPARPGARRCVGEGQA